VKIGFLYAVIGVLLVVGCGVLVYVTTPTNAAWVQNLLGRLAEIRRVCVEQLGRYFGALAVLLALSAAAVLVTWPFGRFARRFKDQIDAPILRYTQHHLVPTGTWHHINEAVTAVGGRLQIKVVVVVASVVFGVLWARRGWWIPGLVLVTSYIAVKLGQVVLADVADRPPVPLPGFEKFPSGGCARIIVTYGLVVYFALLTWPAISRRWRVAGFTAVAVLAFLEGFTRVVLVRHWGMDVVGGCIFGTLMLLAFIAATSCFAPGASAAREVESTSEPADVGALPG
jgi:hypothetical protein